MFCCKKPNMNKDIEKSAALIKARLGNLAPRIAVILGSGLGDFADQVENPVSIPYTQLPGFPRPTVHGHEGKLVAGTIAGVPVICLKGRVHFYEGAEGAAPLKVLMRTMKSIGIGTMFISNAAGSLKPEVTAGNLMAISDHINLSGTNPLQGPNDDEWGPRFVSMGNAWDSDLRAMLIKSAEKIGVPLATGVYAWFLGPTFETSAEIRMAKAVGADIVGMSTVSDCIIARHCGLRVVGCSAVTNMGQGMSDEILSHDQTIEQAAIASKNLVRLVVQFLKDFNAGA